MHAFGSLINGMFSTKGAAIPHLSYVTQEEWTSIHQATKSDVKEALTLIQKPSINLMPPYERAALLNRIAQLLLRDEEKLSRMITLEMGKPIQEAKGEVSYTANYLFWFAEEAKRIYGKTIPSSNPKKMAYTTYAPIGPTAVITPWNFPLAMAGRKIGAAFAAGCPVIAKPSATTPTTLLAFGLLCLEAGLPKEALHILVGDRAQIGDAFLKASFIRKLSFTGSCAVGRELYEKSSATLKKLTLELGGHAPLLVFDDADLEKATEGAIRTKLRQSGQTCVCANRFFVQKKIYPYFLKKFIEKVQKLKIGDPFEETTQLSTALHPTSVEKVQKHLQDAVKKGAKVHLKAQKPFEPEILSGVTEDMLIMHEETFGPIAPIVTFETKEEAIKKANQTPYGLAAYVFTENLRQAETVCSALEFGVIGLNDGAPSAPEIPFGGMKDSGFGREGGSCGIYEYLVQKVVSQG